MNRITKRSFYSFLTLYLLSSFIFLFIASYWFYSSQKAQETQNNYYKMNHIADKISADVIQAHMMNEDFTLDNFPNTKIALYDEQHQIRYGSKLQNIDFTKDYYTNDKTFTLISQGTAGHLGVKYIVVQSSELSDSLARLQNLVIVTTIFVAIAIIIIAVILSYIFLQPIKEKMQEIENFVKDTTHELNTPITALMMSTSRAKNKKVYDEKIIQNISISTKQLYDIYSSLSFLSFDTKSEEAVEIDFSLVIDESIKYFDELLDKKNIAVEFTKDTCMLLIAPSKAKMLINNLLSNAIKYSLPNTKIKIKTTHNSFSIKDEGIGIAKDKLGLIFKRFTRANSYAGGFGVGLNIVDSIVKEYGFDIKINSKEEEGTEIILKFKSINTKKQ